MSPRTASQLVEIRETSVNKILDASLELFAEHGYESTSISQIAKKAGISKGLIYNYFDSKLDLLKGMIDRLNEGETELIGKVIDEDPRKMLRNIFMAFFSEMRDRSEVWKMIATITLQIDKFDFVHEMTVRKLRGFFNLFTDLLTQIGYPNPEQEAKLIGALFDGIGFHYLIAMEEYPLDEVEEFLIKKYCNHELN
jgi:AcrR family transcriptional regulator